MRTKFVTIVLLLSVVFSSCDKEASKRRNKLKPIAQESVESFINTVDAIEWSNHNPPGPNIEDANKPCFQALMDKIGQMPDLEVNKDDLDEILKVYDFSKLIQEPVDEGKFGGIQDADNDFLKHPVRDRILRKIDVDLSNEDFVREVQGSGSLSPEDRVDLEELYAKFVSGIKRKRAKMAVSSKEIGQCILTDLILIRFVGVQPNNRIISFRVKRQFTFVCECGEDMGPDQPMYGYIQFESTLTASYEDNGLYNLVFTGSSKPEITGLNVVCCPNIEEEQSDQDQEGGH